MQKAHPSTLVYYKNEYGCRLRFLSQQAYLV